MDVKEYILTRFPSQRACIKHLERVLWRGKPTCPYCGALKVSRHKEGPQKIRWQCSWCCKSFSVTVGTIFQKSHVDLRIWFTLMAVIIKHKNELNSVEMANLLGMRRPTVTSMMKRINENMKGDWKILAQLLEINPNYEFD